MALAHIQSMDKGVDANPRTLSSQTIGERHHILPTGPPRQSFMTFSSSGGVPVNEEHTKLSSPTG
jgi:hypothetical protein